MLLIEVMDKPLCWYNATEISEFTPASRDFVPITPTVQTNTKDSLLSSKEAFCDYSRATCNPCPEQLNAIPCLFRPFL